MRKAPMFVLGVLILLGLALAVEPPQNKEGLWSIRMQTTNQPGNTKTDFTYKLCRSHAFDQHGRDLAKNRKECKPVSENFSGGIYTAESECNVMGTVIKSKTTTTFQGDTASHGETHATNTPALNGVSEMTVIMDQKYLGACPAGIQPGDRVNADGSIMHLWRN
jgi:hypothetical protein